MRLIDGNALKDTIRGDFDFSFYKISSSDAEFLQLVLDEIDDAPTIEPVKHGHWICEYDCELGETDITCSVCRDTRSVNGCYVSYKGESLYHDDNFCPYCGAKMDEGASR